MNSQKVPQPVTPANPGSSLPRQVVSRGPGQAPGSITIRAYWIPAFAGMTEKSFFRLFAKPSPLTVEPFKRYRITAYRLPEGPTSLPLTMETRKRKTRKSQEFQFPEEPQVSPTFLNLTETKRGRIIAAATREFSEKGYQGASINTLVDGLGISKGSIFQYFNSKKGLFLFIFQAAVDRVRRTLVGVKEETEDLEVYERIRQSILAGVDFVRRHPQIYRIYLKLLFDREAPYRAELLQAIRFFSSEYLGSLVEKGLERGEIREDIPLDQAVFILDAVLDRFLQAYMVPYLDQGSNIYQGDPQKVEAWSFGLVRILRKGLQG